MTTTRSFVALAASLLVLVLVTACGNDDDTSLLDMADELGEDPTEESGEDPPVDPGEEPTGSGELGPDDAFSAAVVIDGEGVEYVVDFCSPTSTSFQFSGTSFDGDGTIGGEFGDPEGDHYLNVTLPGGDELLAAGPGVAGSSLDVSERGDSSRSAVAVLVGNQTGESHQATVSVHC